MLNKKEASVDGNGNVVIQNSDNSSITINTNNPEEVRKALIDLQREIQDLPLTVIQKLMENNKSEVPANGVNVYLSLNVLFETLSGKPTGNVSGISFGVSVTNLFKDNRYFYEPYFKSSIPIEKELDTFVLTDKQSSNPVFPKKLEYGEPFTAYYNITSMDVFKTLVERDSNATITALVNTTLGEVFLSNEYKLSELLKEEKYVNK